jgi:cytidyltransferase-like protein
MVILPSFHCLRQISFSFVSVFEKHTKQKTRIMTTSTTSFETTLDDRCLKEWRFYCVDYKELKQALQEDGVTSDEFLALLGDSETKLSKFYQDKEQWAFGYMKTLEERVTDLRDVVANPPQDETSMCSSTASSSLSDSSGSSSEEEDNEEPCVTLDLEKKSGKGHEWLKEAYRKMGASKHFHKYIYAKKSLMTFHRELELLLEFLDLNKQAFEEILKDHDQATGLSLRDSQMAKIMESHSYLDGTALEELQDEVSSLIEETNSLKPNLPRGWQQRKVYTIGCFDLFHRGHQNVLVSLREFGCYIVAGIHDDESYFKLKSKYTIDNLETRMKNVKPYVDQLYVIPSTDPLLYIKSVVSEQDIQSGACCYARGDDMLHFPGREWVESVMPVHFVPRTEACSSTLIRTIYHAEDETIRAKAAFAKTRYDGKPIDEEGNVLNLKKQ